MKKIIFLIGTLGSGGAERFVTNLALYLRHNTDWIPYIFCLIGKEGCFIDTLEKSGIAVIDVNTDNREKIGIRTYYNLYKMLKDLEPDIVHSQINFSIVQQSLTNRLSGNSKFFVTERNCYEPGSILRRSWWAIREKAVSNFIHLRSANSAKVAKHLAGLIKVDSAAIPVTYNGVYLDHFTKRSHKSYNESRRNLGIKPQEILIGTVARFHPNKGHRCVIDLIPKWISEYSLKFVFAGQGPEMSNLKARARDLNVEEYILWLGNRNDIPEILSAFDIFVLFSRREGMPNSVLEAMSVGLPCVASDVGGVSEILENGKSGILIPSGDSEALFQSIVALCKDKELRDKLGAEAHKRCQRLFSMEACAHKYLKLYKDLIGQNEIV